MSKIFRGDSPSRDGQLQVPAKAPDGFPFTPSAERIEEFSPGLTPEIQALVAQLEQLK
jgi:Mn-containing catalase